MTTSQQTSQQTSQTTSLINFYNDPSSIRDLCAAIVDGENVRTYVARLGLRYADVACWIAADRERAFLYDQALTLSGDRLAFEALEIADSDEVMPADKKVRIDTRLRIAGKWSPYRYGEKTMTEVKQVASADPASPIPETDDWIAGVLADGTEEAPAVSGADGPVFSAPVSVEPEGHGARVDVSEVPGSTGES